MDEKFLFAGDSIITKVQEAIDRALLVVVVLSKHSLNSGWVTKELEQATIAEIEGKTKVIPIIRDQVERIPGFLRPKMYADFSGWPHDQEQYSRSLNLLIRSIVAYGNGPASTSEAKFVKSRSGAEQTHSLISDKLLNQIPMEYVHDWPLGRLFKGTFRLKKGYIDGADNVWTVGRRSIRSMAKNMPELQIGNNGTGQFVGEDHQGRLWYLVNRELFVSVQNKWVGISLPNAASTKVSLWASPPTGVVGPITSFRTRVTILSTSGWSWNEVASPIGVPEAILGSGTNLLIANTDSWALMQFPTEEWCKVTRYTSRISKPVSLWTEPSGAGFWVHCADHSLFWVKLDDLRCAPLPLGVKQGLPGARVDAVLTRRQGELWCAGSGGVAFSAVTARNKFMVLTDKIPQIIWTDHARRVWAIFNKEIWCWVEE